VDDQLWHNLPNAFRGSSEVAAFCDSLIDLKKAIANPAEIRVTHAKSRWEEPIPPFTVEIIDPAEDATVVRYTGEAKGQFEEKLEIAQEFLLGFLASGDPIKRQDYVQNGKEQNLGEDVLDKARKKLIQTGMIVKWMEGRDLYIGLQKPSVRPDTPIGPTDDSDEREGLEE
jgi:hypothetical protein